MSKVEKNENLFIRQEGFELSREIYIITTNESFYHAWNLRDQTGHAAISEMSNITEEFERYSKLNYARFMAVARGSCAEIKNQPYLAHSLSYVTGEDFKKFLEFCSLLSESIGKCGGSTNRRGVQ